MRKKTESRSIFYSLFSMRYGRRAEAAHDYPFVTFADSAPAP